MLQLGQVGIFALPWPVYREGLGWDFGGISYVSLGADRPSGAWLALGLDVWYNERERRQRVSVNVIPIWHADDRWRAESCFGLIDSPGETGLGAAAILTYSRPEERGGAFASWRFVTARFTSLHTLGESVWSTGKDRWIEANSEMAGLGGRATLGMRFNATARLAPSWLGGDFDYRRVSTRLAWARPHYTVWGVAGASSGTPPVQEQFDVAVDGQIKGIPIWQSRPKDFAAFGVETRMHVLQEIFMGAFGTVAGGTGLRDAMWEGGISLTFANDEQNSEPHDWFIQIDFPLYSSASEHFSDQPKWDLGRFMVRVNLLTSDITGSDINRYRYPNR